MEISYSDTYSWSDDEYLLIKINELPSPLIKSEKTGWLWGHNSYGTLGNNSTISKSTPVAVCGGHSFVILKTLSTNVSIGLDTNHQGWAWGYNNNGQLGDNSTTNRSTPIAIYGGHTFLDISVGFSYSIGLDIHGQAWSWGNNGYGQLGDYSVSSQITPVAVCGGHTFCEITASFYHSHAIDINGKCWSWGANGNGGMLGNNDTGNKSTPVAVCGNHKFLMFSSSYGHILALDYNDVLWGWGYNSYGQLGDNSTTDRLTPIQVCTYGDVTYCDVMANVNFSVAIQKSGSDYNYIKAYSWGLNNYGQLGDNSTVCRSSPVPVCCGYGYPIQKLINGFDSATIGVANPYVWSWGKNNYGQLGDYSTVNQSVPTQVCTSYFYKSNTWINVDFAKVALPVSGATLHLEYYGGHGLLTNGRLFNWGYDGNYTIGGGNASIPRLFPTNNLYKTMTSYSYSVGAIDKNNKTWAWGYNSSGELGDGTNITRSTPVAVCGNHTFYKISSFWYGHNYLDNNNKVWNNGWGLTGDLGNNAAQYKCTPVAVCGNHTFCTICGAGGIDNLGKTWLWGANGYGQLGINSLTNKSTPVAVYGNHTFCKISRSYYFSCAITNLGKVWSWGMGGFLGDNSSTRRCTPVAVCGNHTFCYVACKYDHTIAIDNNGKAWGWGSNSYGELGTNNKTFYTTPVEVYGNHTFCQVDTGFSFTIAIDNNCKMWGWGNGYFYRLTTFTSCYSTPIQLQNRWQNIWHNILQSS